MSKFCSDCEVKSRIAAEGCAHVVCPHRKPITACQGRYGDDVVSWSEYARFLATLEQGDDMK